MPVLDSPFSAQDLSNLTGWPVTKATTKLQPVRDRLVKLMGNPQLWASSARPDRVAGALIAFARTLVALADGDERSVALWVTTLMRKQKS